MIIDPQALAGANRPQADPARLATDGVADFDPGAAAGPRVRAAPRGAGETRRPLWRGIALLAPLVALGWLATLALAALVSDAAPARYVFLPKATLLADLPEASLLGAGPGWLILASDRPDFTLALYRAGATLVLPAGLQPCGPALPRV